MTSNNESEKPVHKLILLGLAATLLALTACGGGSGTNVGASNTGGGTPQTSNTVALVVDGGPDASTQGNDVDTPFITVTVCAPGSTTNCQQIDHVEVDTASYGLRIMSSVLNSSLAAALQPETGSTGQPIVECTEFADGFTWGPVALADVQIAGESAGSVPIQITGDSSYEHEIPSGCTGSEEDTVAAFGANGIIGVGPFATDCGDNCANSAANGFYYTCPPGSTSTTACTGAAVSGNNQVTDPVALFATDNNGVIVQLPSVPDPDGALTASGTLIFGIGTEGNNGMGNATVLTGSNYADITTTYAGTQLPFSYFDTGSNAYYFDANGAITDCPTTGSTSSVGSWLCPASELTIDLQNMGQNGAVSDVSINIANANNLFTGSGTQYNTAFDDLGVDTQSQAALPQCKLNGSTDCSFDFGLPFFFGRTVYVAFVGANTPAGMGPYFAY